MEQSIQYLRALMYIASVDDAITDDEYTCFMKIAITNGLSEKIAAEIREEIAAETIDFSATLSAITDEKSKKQLLHDLLVMCYADDCYSVPEQQGIRDIAIVLGVSDKKLGQIEREVRIAHSMQKATGSVSVAINAGAESTAVFGKKALAGGNKLMHSVADGLNVIGSKISFSLESAKKAKEENKALREQLKKVTLTEAIKQKVIVQLGAKIANLTEQLHAEKKRNQKNEEMIRELQAQIDDLMETMEVAQNVKTA